MELKIREILGDKLGVSDYINLRAAEAFPRNNRLYALMVRSLSPDIPSAKLSSKEQEELDEALRNKE